MAQNTNAQRRKGQENKAFYFFVSISLVLIVAIVYVYGMPEVTAEEYIERCQEMYTDALNDGVSDTVGTPFTATIAGETAQCLYLSYTTAENVQTQEQLLNEAQTLLAGLTIIR